MSSLIRQNGSSATAPTAPAASPSTKSSTGGGASFGPFCLSGTAAMMSEILKLIQDLCTIENMYGELAKTDISEASQAAENNATAAYSAGMAQSDATRDQAYTQLGSALSNVGGLAAMGWATYKYSGVTEIDNQLNINKNVTAKMTEASAASVSDDYILEGESAEGRPTAKTITKDQEELAKALKNGSFGTVGSRSLAKYTDEDYEGAAAYIRKTAGSVEKAQETFNEISASAKENTSTLTSQKDAILRQRDQLSQAANNFAQIGSSVSQTAGQSCAANAQQDGATAEQDKAYTQYTEQVAQTAQQQVLSGRDNKDQQISQTLQLIQSAVAANQIN